MVEINLQQLRDHLSVFEPGYPLQKGYVAQLLFQHSLSDVIKQVKAIVTAAEPNKNLHEGSLRGRLSVFKKFIASSKNRLLTEWPKHIALLLESFLITFKCPTLSPAIESTPSAATSSEHPEQTSTQIPVKLKHFSQTLDTQIHPDLPQTPDTLIHPDLPQTPDTLIHSDLPQTPDTLIHSDLPQTPDTPIHSDLPQTPDTLIQSDNLQTSTPTQTAPPTQTPLPINSQSYSATCSSQSPIKLKNSCASCFTKQCTNINMMQENEHLRHQLQDLKMLLRAEKKHLSLKRLNEKIRRETESMIWRNKYITLKASNDAQKLLDSVYSLEQKVKTLEENLIATQEESLNMTSVIEQLKSMHEKTENNDAFLKYVSSNSPSHNAYTLTNVEENETVEYNSQSSLGYREGALFDRASKDLIIKTKNMVEDVSCTQDVRSEEENSHTQTEAAESDIIMDYQVVMAGIKNNPNDECSEELQQGRSTKLLEQGLPACQKTTQQNVSNIAISSMNPLEEILASKKSCRLSALHVSKPCTIGNKFDSSGRTLKENIFQNNRQTHAKDNLYKCDVCDRQFAKNMYLKIHKNTCSRDKPFKCDVCGHEFLTEGYLRIHTRTHTGEKPYKCDVCGHAFTWSRHRDAHQRSHISEKPFQCDVCGLCFAQKYSLKIHTRTHSRTLKCKVCGLEFVKADMEKHKEVHKGEKNCVCNICGKRFKTKSLLKSHTRIHSRIPFKCKVCGLEFEKKAGMKKHKEVHAYNHADVGENGTVVYNSQSSVCYREDVLSDEASHDLLINPKNMVEDVCYTQDVRSQEEKTTHTHTEAVESVMIMDYQDMMAGIENDPDDECSEDLHQGRSSKLLEQGLSACQKTTQQNVANIISSINFLEEILSSQTSCQPSVLHVGEHHTIGNKCDASGPTFKENIFQKHRPKHAKYKLYKCAVCGRRFAKDSLLKIHKRAHTKDKSYRCNISGHGFSVKENLRMHTRTYTGEKPYKCDVCGLTFSESGDRDVHKQSHAGDRPYKCDFCGLCFTQKYSLEIHTRTHSITQLKCKVCGLEFEEKADMRKHKEVHKGEKNCVCDICGQRFKTKSLLTSHTRKHTGEKPYHCEVCGKSFAHNNAFKSHIRIHTEERPYKCDICGFAFRQSSSLSSHKLIHTGEKPYVCDICGFQVNRKDNLRLHKRVHQKKT